MTPGPDFDRQAEIATEVSIAVMEAALGAVKDHGPDLTEDEVVGLLTGMLRAAGRWVSFTMPAEMDAGVHLMLGKMLEQERRQRLSDQMGGVQ
jgi:hypothetical protein